MVDDHRFAISIHHFGVAKPTLECFGLRLVLNFFIIRAHNPYIPGIASGVGRQDAICHSIEIRRVGVLSHAGREARVCAQQASVTLSCPSTAASHCRL